MKFGPIGVVALLAVMVQPTFALDELTKDAAIGGAIGGALGGVVGAEVGGRSGAIVGAGVGGAAGAAIATDGDDEHHGDRQGDFREVHDHDHHHYYEEGHPHGHFCPPGQAKKGRC